MARSKQTDIENAVWLRQPGESDKAFAAFQCFLDLGEERTITEVAKRLSKSRQLIDGWRSKFGWRERAAEYDDYLVSEKAKKARREVEARYERFGKASDHAFAHGASYLKGVDPTKLTHRQAVELLMLSMQMADKSKSVLVQSEREAVEIEVAKRRLELEYLRLEAQNPATAPEDSGSNFEEALRDAVDDVWSEYEKEPGQEGDDDE
jgi:hypothetical protein